MAKSSGSTRASASGNPRGLGGTENTPLRGLGAIRANIQEAINNGGASWRNTDLVQLRIQEEDAMRDALDSFAGKNGWEKGFNNITKSYGEGDILSSKEPIKAMEISVSTYGSGIDKGSYYKVTVGGSSVSGNRDYTEEVRALNNNDKQFKAAAEAIKWADSQARRINKKYKGKI